MTISGGSQATATARTWQSARDACKRVCAHGDLVSIHSAADDASVSGFGSLNWIGLNHLFKEPAINLPAPVCNGNSCTEAQAASLRPYYEWSDGTPYDYGNSAAVRQGWGAGQPNEQGGDEDCVAMHDGRNGNTKGWHDYGDSRNCQAKLSFICAFDKASCCYTTTTSKVTPPVGALSTKPNCTTTGTTVQSGGAVVNHFGTRYGSKPGSCSFTCASGSQSEDATCIAGAWSNTVPQCAGTVCLFNLSLPNGASASCAHGQHVANGSSCVMTKPQHSCESTMCIGPHWNTSSPACTPDPCDYGQLTVDSHAYSADSGCGNGSTVHSGNSCTFIKAGFDCESTSCSAGKWTDTSISCVPKSCEFSYRNVRGSAGAWKLDAGSHELSFMQREAGFKLRTIRIVSGNAVFTSSGTTEVLANTGTLNAPMVATGGYIWVPNGATGPKGW